jgi:hypothetical protein
MKAPRAKDIMEESKKKKVVEGPADLHLARHRRGVVSRVVPQQTLTHIIL